MYRKRRKNSKNEDNKNAEKTKEQTNNPKSHYIQYPSKYVKKK